VIKIKISKNIMISVLTGILLTLIFIWIFSGCRPGLLFESNNSFSESAEDTVAVKTSQAVGQDDSDTSDSKEYADDFTLMDLDGNQISLYDYKNKIVVLNFWATWCPPCQAEIPDFVEVSNTYMDKGVQFLGVSNDFDKSLKAFAQQYKINYPTLLDGTNDNVFSKWGIKAIPHTFVLGKKGEILFEQLGMMGKDQLIDSIEAALLVKQ
jgi:peroxiredoxin